jgi:hypothetical protein
MFSKPSAHTPNRHAKKALKKAQRELLTPKRINDPYVCKEERKTKRQDTKDGE